MPSMSKCHPDRPLSAHGMCKPCYDIENWKQLKANPIKYAEHRKNAKKRYQLNPRAVYGYVIKSLYGITLDERDSIFKKQRGVCAICKLAIKGKQEIDHCHSSGAVRGILCHRCNMLLGMAQDSIKTLMSAIRYLKKYDQSKKAG